MQLRHVSTNLRQGLRRNLSMHAAVILTLFVSLSLAGFGVLLNKEATLTNDVLGDELQISVYLCVPDEPRYQQCVSEVTPEQERAVIAAVEANPEVKSWELISHEEAKEKYVALYGSEPFDGPDPIITAADLPKSILITLKDPKDFDGVVSAVENLDGVRSVQTAQELVGGVFTLIDAVQWVALGAAAILIAAAVMMVANTIRLAALARRREIEIMRLVGASRIFIVLPFMLEALFNAAVGFALAAGALAAIMKWGVIEGLDARLDVLPFIGWEEYLETLVVIGIAAPVLTVVPTLLLTRKYLKF